MGTGKTEYNDTDYAEILSNLKSSENYANMAYGHMSTYYRNAPTDYAVLSAIQEEATKYDSTTNEILENMSAENEATLKRQYYYPYTNAHSSIDSLKDKTNLISDNIGIIVSSVTAIGDAASAFEATKGFEKNGEPDNTPDDSVYTDGSGKGNGTGDNGNGTAAGNDLDKEGDGVADQNTDNNQTGDSKVNIDKDGDGKADLNIDTNGDGVADLNIDKDGDGVADLNIDTNGDGVADLNIDKDGDGVADLNIDTNGDGKADLNIDTDGDGKADLNIDTNGDGKADVNIDLDGDGKADINIDTNGDGIADLNIDLDGDGKPDLNIDTNGDGIADVNIDKDGNGYPDTNIDINGDGIPDINVDTDGDGIPDKNVIPGYEHGAGDDGDGSFLSDLLKRMKLMVDDDGNIMYYDENGNIVYPFLGEGMFADPANAQKFKMAENAFLEMLDGPEKGDAVEALDLDLEKNVSSASFAIGGMAAVGAAAANAAATMKRTKDEIDEGVRTYDYEYDDDAKLTPEQYKKRKTGTIVSMVLLTLLILANAIALIINGTSDVTIVLLGLATAITGIITSMGIKQGKFYTIGAVLVNLLIVYILTCLGFTTSLGYVIAFAVLVIVLLYYYFTKLFERILPMFNYVPAVVGIVGIGFVGLLSVFEITHWIINLILVILIIAGYFAYNYYGIAQLEEQMEQEKQKGLSIYDYFNLKTNRKQWKYKGNIEETQIIPQTKQTSNNVELPKVNNSNKKYGKHGDNKFLEYMDNSNNKGNNQDNNNNSNNNNPKFFN